jgi:hypothetical protein
LEFPGGAASDHSGPLESIFSLVPAPLDRDDYGRLTPTVAMAVVALIRLDVEQLVFD